MLEEEWKRAPGQERPLWRGLAQLAVGLTHAQRGNARGAVTLLSRGADGIASFGAQPLHGLDPARLAARARALSESITCDGLPAEPPRLRLVE